MPTTVTALVTRQRAGYAIKREQVLVSDDELVKATQSGQVRGRNVSLASAHPLSQKETSPWQRHFENETVIHCDGHLLKHNELKHVCVCILPLYAYSP
jgi:hypothetical protein